MYYLISVVFTSGRRKDEWYGAVHALLSSTIPASTGQSNNLVSICSLAVAGLVDESNQPSTSSGPQTGWTGLARVPIVAATECGKGKN